MYRVMTCCRQALVSCKWYDMLCTNESLCFKGVKWTLGLAYVISIGEGQHPVS